MQNTPLKITDIYIASDHAGYYLKQELIQHSGLILQDLGHDSENAADYPDYAGMVAEKITNLLQMGILICGSGIGMSIAANRYSHIRAALCMNANMAKLARAHNDANILVLASREVSFEQASQIIQIFFSTPFEGGRHTKRLEKIK